MNDHHYMTAPTIDQVREWGYDEEALFMDQDEDVVLHAARYVPILLELGTDSACPKSDYCLSILTHYAQLQLAARNLTDIRAIHHHILNCEHALSEKAQRWKEQFLHVHQLIVDPRPITEDEAREVAVLLIAGEYCSRSFQELGKLGSGFIEYLASTDSYKEYLYIHPGMAFWRSSRYVRLEEYF